MSRTPYTALQYAYDRIMEGEGRDRISLKLNPNQEALWKVGTGFSLALIRGQSMHGRSSSARCKAPSACVLSASSMLPTYSCVPQDLVSRTTKRIIVVLMHGGGLDSEWLQGACSWWASTVWWAACLHATGYSSCRRSLFFTSLRSHRSTATCFLCDPPFRQQTSHVLCAAFFYAPVQSVT